MRPKTLAALALTLSLAAGAATAAADKAAPKPASSKPAAAKSQPQKPEATKTDPAKATAKPAAGKPAAPRASGPFDARDPASLIAFLGTLDAKGQITETSGDGVDLSVTTPAFSFGAHYAGCDERAKACKGLAFTALSEQKRATLAQLNGFNQSSMTCRVFMDSAGKSHVMYSTLVSVQDTREEMRTHLSAWQGCMASFGDFLRDPNAYLAAAP